MVRVELGPLTPEQALALAEAVTEDSPLPPHLVRLAAERSGGSPQFLRDLLRAAAAGSTELPDSIEGAALARMEMNSLFSELIPRLESIERAGTPELSATTFVGGLKHLPIRYSVR